jgi:hypothetical protein
LLKLNTVFVVAGSVALDSPLLTPIKRIRSPVLLLVEPPSRVIAPPSVPRFVPLMEIPFGFLRMGSMAVIAIVVEFVPPLLMAKVMVAAEPTAFAARISPRSVPSPAVAERLSAEVVTTNCPTP